MDRRQFVKTSVAAASLTATSLTAELAEAAAPKHPARKPPNVLYIFSDQHRAVSQPGEPLTDVVSPNIAAFRAANFSMDHCVSNYPLCTPYRGILMTGKYPCASGLTTNGLKMATSEHTLTRTFKEAGYNTGYVGKWHLGNDGKFTPPGPERFDIDYWHTWAQTNNHYHSFTFDPESGARQMPEGWGPLPMTDQAITFLKAQSSAKPWMMMLSWNPPHPPFDPPAVDQQPYQPATFKQRPNVQVGTSNLKPLKSQANLREAMRGYYGGITGVDEQFGRLLKALDDSGMAKNTIVIYTADHGEMMGSQGRMSKQVPYEESCRVPFSVRLPGVTKASGSSKSLFAAIDIYPTVCGLAGLTVPAHCQGHDLSGIMRGEHIASPDIVFLMCGGDSGGHGHKGRKSGAGPDAMQTRRPNRNAQLAADPNADPVAPQAGQGDNEDPTGPDDREHAPHYRGCRTDTHTYAVTVDGRWMLHDNIADPYQQHNLALDPAQHALMASLDAKIQAWMKTTGDTFIYPANL